MSEETTQQKVALVTGADGPTAGFFSEQGPMPW